MTKNKNKPRIIDADGHVRETDEEIIEFMSAGYRNRRDAMLYFPLTPHHGWHRSIPANDFRRQDFRVQGLKSRSEEEDHLRQRQAILPALKTNAFKSFNPPDRVRGQFNRCAPFKPLEPPETI